MGPWFKQRHYTALAVVSLVQTTSPRSRDSENQTGKGCQPQTADWRLSANLDADQYGPTYRSTQTNMDLHTCPRRPIWTYIHVHADQYGPTYMSTQTNTDLHTGPRRSIWTYIHVHADQYGPTYRSTQINMDLHTCPRRSIWTFIQVHADNHRSMQTKYY